MDIPKAQKNVVLEAIEEVIEYSRANEEFLPDLPDSGLYYFYDPFSTKEERLLSPELVTLVEAWLDKIKDTDMYQERTKEILNRKIN